MKRGFAALVLLLLTASSGHAGFDEGAAAWRDGDLGKALAEWQPLAEKGNADAQYALGFLYEMGHGVAKDYKVAAEWYRKAGDQGHVTALYALGLLTELGRLGLPPDFAAARALYEKSASLGGPGDAEFALARMYLKGRGLPRDDKQALAWADKAARKGHPGGQYLLGMFNETGWGAGPDLGKAYYWYSMAERVGSDKLQEYDISYNAKLALQSLRGRLSSEQRQEIEAKVKAHSTAPSPRMKSSPTSQAAQDKPGQQKAERPEGGRPAATGQVR